MAGLQTPAPVRDVPSAAALVRDFVNTTDRETATDELTTPAELTGWLHQRGLLARRTPATPADLALAHRLRSGLRQALELNHDATPSGVPALDEALALLPLRLVWEGERWRLSPVGTGVVGALARLAAAMEESVAAGAWWRLKICSSDECEWAYYDGSKNRARAWCEYGCGNRAKVRAYRARRRAASG